MNREIRVTEVHTTEPLNTKAIAREIAHLIKKGEFFNAKNEHDGRAEIQRSFESAWRTA